MKLSNELPMTAKEQIEAEADIIDRFSETRAQHLEKELERFAQWQREEAFNDNNQTWHADTSLRSWLCADETLTGQAFAWTHRHLLARHLGEDKQ